MNIVCTVEARMNSSRLPGKVMKKIENKTILEILLNRISRAKKINNIVIATSYNSKDERIINLCKEKKINFFRGSEKNVLKRLVDAGKFFSADVIVQLTADNPLIDPDMIDYMIKFFTNNKNIDYLTNNGLGHSHSRKVPMGLDIQIFYYNDLKNNYMKSKGKLDLMEHPSLFFYREGKNFFKLHNIDLPKKFYINQNYRLTLDTKKDFLVIKKIYLYFLKKKNINFSTRDLSNFLRNNKSVMKINENIIQKKVKLLA